MAADVDLDGTIVGTDTTLYAPRRIWNNKTRHQSLAAGGITLENTINIH
jgi:hypothetical protein